MCGGIVPSQRPSGVACWFSSFPLLAARGGCTCQGSEACTRFRRFQYIARTAFRGGGGGRWAPLRQFVTVFHFQQQCFCFWLEASVEELFHGVDAKLNVYFLDDSTNWRP